MFDVGSRLRARRAPAFVGAIMLLATLLVGCGGDDGSIEGGQDPPFAPGTNLFRLVDVGDLEYPAGHEDERTRTLLMIERTRLPSGTVRLDSFLVTPCGPGHTSPFTVDENRLIYEHLEPDLRTGWCTSEQFAASERIVRVFNAGPTFVFDNGELLTIYGDGTQVSFEFDETIVSDPSHQ